MDALFNVFGFGMQKPDEKWKFFENQKNRNIEQQEEKRKFPKGYYANQQKLLDDKYRTLSIGGKTDMTIDRRTGQPIGPSIPNQAHPGMNLNKIQQQAAYKDQIMLGGTGINQQNTEQLGFFQKLSNMANVDFDKAAAHWKDKGGFEGLMANPAFTMGLAFMQAGAEGKTLGSGAMDNVLKAAGISSHYKRLMEAKAGGVTEVTTGQMDQIKSILGTKGISAPILRKLKPGAQGEMYEQAVEDIAFKVQKKVNKMKKDAKASGKDIEVGSRLYKKVIDQMIKDKEIDKVGGLNIGGYQVIDATLETKARGGPVTQGKAYIVGEEGPEVIIPHSSGNVLSTDDSQIFAMLLAANPQLQKVSKARAEKIMRSRFPEYFE